MQATKKEILAQINAKQHHVKGLTLLSDDLVAEAAELVEKIRVCDLSLGVKENEIVFLTRQQEAVTRTLEGYKQEAKLMISRRETKEIALAKVKDLF